MSTQPTEFRRGAVKPILCLQEGWRLVREQYWLFLGITVVGMLIGNSVPFGIVLGPMMCGIYLCLFARQRGEPVRFEMLFKGFDHFRESLIAAMAQVVPVFVLTLFMQLVFVIGISITSLNQSLEPAEGGAAPPEAFFATFGLIVLLFGIAALVMLLVTVFFVFTYPLIVERKLSGIDSIKLSFRAVLGNLGGVVGLLLLQLVLGFLGLLLCYVGALLFVPIGFAAWAIAYQQVFQRETHVPDLGVT